MPMSDRDQLRAALDEIGVGRQQIRAQFRQLYRDSPRMRESELRRLLTKQNDLSELWDKGFVDINAHGNNIATIYVEINNCTDVLFHVWIRPGTRFVSNGRHQGMTSRQSDRFDLNPNETFKHLVLMPRCRYQIVMTVSLKLRQCTMH